MVYMFHMPGVWQGMLARSFTSRMTTTGHSLREEESTIAACFVSNDMNDAYEWVLSGVRCRGYGQETLGERGGEVAMSGNLSFGTMLHLLLWLCALPYFHLLRVCIYILCVNVFVLSRLSEWVARLVVVVALQIPSPSMCTPPKHLHVCRCFSEWAHVLACLCVCTRAYVRPIIELSGSHCFDLPCNPITTSHPTWTGTTLPFC